MGKSSTILVTYTMFSYFKGSTKRTIPRTPSLDAPPRVQHSTTRVRKNTVRRPISWYMSRPTLDAPVKESDLFKSESRSQSLLQPLPEFNETDMIHLNASCKRIHELKTYFYQHKKLFSSLSPSLFEYTNSVIDVAVHHCKWKPFLKEYLVMGKYYPNKKAILHALDDVFHKIPKTIETLEEHKREFESLGTRFGGHKNTRKNTHKRK